jgi:broad-specificity NMP kinase
MIKKSWFLLIGLYMNMMHPAIDDINIFVETLPLRRAPLFVFVTGASGAGKTHLTNVLEQQLDPHFFHVVYFDTIGVPSVKEMIEQWGSCEQWQEATTHQWIAKLATIEKPVVILEGQFNPQFVLDACKKQAVEQFLLFVVHADRSVREKRLLENRLQPELINDDMNNWAEFLKVKSLELGGTLIDTTASDIDQNISGMMGKIKQTLINAVWPS